MRLAVRVDATNEMGTGHFMRCLTVADAAARRGARVRFLARHLPAHLRAMLSERGYEFAALSGAPAATDDLRHAHWLGTSQAADAQATVCALSDHAWDWIVVDHYALDARWEEAVRGVVARILAIDDLADRAHACDVLLDQNLHADMEARYAGRVPNGCELLLGPRYVLLREEFRRWRARARVRTGHVERVLVFFGGVDLDNYTALAIDVLAHSGLPGLRVDVVIGAQHPHREAIRSACAASNFEFHLQTDRMAGLMATADLGIGAAGSASWERCCVGLPAICVATAINQVGIAEGLQARGAVVALPSLTAQSLSDTLMSLIRRPQQVRSLFEVASALVDGAGADRVCDRLVRPA